MQTRDPRQHQHPFVGGPLDGAMLITVEGLTIPPDFIEVHIRDQSPVEEPGFVVAYYSQSHQEVANGVLEIHYVPAEADEMP